MKQSSSKLPIDNSWKDKRVLICPLDWGLGHATRCIPIIEKLLEHEAKVFIGSSGAHAQLLRLEFPQLPILELPGYNIRYHKSGNMALSMFLQLGKIFRKINIEQSLVNQWNNDYHFDTIISDNRFGCYIKGLNNIFITHQLAIVPPKGWNWLSPWVKRWNYYHIHNFNSCWVPDYAEAPGLAGLLSHPDSFPVPTKYIGPISRFKGPDNTVEKKFTYVAVISGPEPQRTLLEQELLPLLKNTGKSCVLVQGKPNEHNDSQEENLRIISHLNAQELGLVMQQAECIISRTGYTTVMDLEILELPAILIPTPGQTEQVYLAEHLKSKPSYRIQYQGEIQL